MRTDFPGLKFEPIDEGHSRAKVIGGWLVKSFSRVAHEVNGMIDYNLDCRISMCFVPDHLHKWIIREESKDDKGN